MGTTHSSTVAGERSSNGGDETAEQAVTMGNNGGDEKAEQAVTMELIMKTLHGDPEVERQKVIRLLGLDLGDGKDEVVWLEKSLGLQSRCFLVHGERWKGLGKQPVKDPLAMERGTAFVKALPKWNIKDMIADIRDVARDDAEKAARALGKTEDEVLTAGKQASQEVDVIEFTEPSLQMVRERAFFRAWQRAEKDGDLQLPEDTLLVIPRFFDNINAGPGRDMEEEKPTILVFEDLVAAGFEIRSYKEAISVEDAAAVSSALADFHAALWRIRDRLSSVVEAEGEAGEVATATTSVKTGNRSGSGKYEKMLRECLDKFRNTDNFILKSVVELMEPQVPQIVAAAADRCGTPRLYGHGDPWAHNVMLRRDEQSGKINGVAFVDLGNVRMMNPLVDLFCFLGTMATRYSWQSKSVARDEYEKRLRMQLPPSLLLDAHGNKLNLFSYENQLRARAVMLLYFLDCEVWWVTNAAGEFEPGDRQAAAFVGAAKIAKKAMGEYEEQDRTQFGTGSEARFRKKAK